VQELGCPAGQVVFASGWAGCVEERGLNRAKAMFDVFDRALGGVFYGPNESFQVFQRNSALLVPVFVAAVRFKRQQCA